jgi:hypothetical protein
MNKTSIYNAILASGYITTLVSLMSLVSNTLQKQTDNMFMPITMLALLVLSVAVMSYLFFYQPILLLLENKRAEAVKTFLGTVTVFAGITTTFLVLALLISK